MGFSREISVGAVEESGDSCDIYRRDVCSSF